MGPRVPFAPALLTLSLHITLHIYFISSRLFILLYVTCAMVNKAVKKQNKKKKHTRHRSYDKVNFVNKDKITIADLFSVPVRLFEEHSYCVLSVHLTAQRYSVVTSPQSCARPQAAAVVHCPSSAGSGERLVVKA